MIIPVIWRRQDHTNHVPAWDTQISSAFPARSPFAAALQRAALDAWRLLAGKEAQLLHLEAIGPECLQVQDDSRIHLLLAGPSEIMQIWPLVHEALVLPLEGHPTEAWLLLIWIGKDMTRFDPSARAPGCAR